MESNKTFCKEMNKTLPKKKYWLIAILQRLTKKIMRNKKQQDKNLLS